MGPVGAGQLAAACALSVDRKQEITSSEHNNKGAKHPSTTRSPWIVAPWPPSGVMLKARQPSTPRQSMVVPSGPAAASSVIFLLSTRLVLDGPQYVPAGRPEEGGGEPAARWPGPARPARLLHTYLEPP